MRETFCCFAKFILIEGKSCKSREKFIQNFRVCYWKQTNWSTFCTLQFYFLITLVFATKSRWFCFSSERARGEAIRFSSPKISLSAPFRIGWMSKRTSERERELFNLISHCLSAIRVASGNLKVVNFPSHCLSLAPLRVGLDVVAQSIRLPSSHMAELWERLQREKKTQWICRHKLSSIEREWIYLF